MGQLSGNGWGAEQSEGLRRTKFLVIYKQGMMEILTNLKFRILTGLDIDLKQAKKIVFIAIGNARRKFALYRKNFMKI